MESIDDQLIWAITYCSKFYVSMVKLKSIVTRHEQDLRYLYENDLKKMDQERDLLFKTIRKLEDRVKSLETERMNKNKEIAQNILINKTVDNYERTVRNQQKDIDNVITRVQDNSGIKKVSYAEVTSNKTYFISENLQDEHTNATEMSNNSLDIAKFTNYISSKENDKVEIPKEYINAANTYINAQDNSKDKK